jgi:hypothetical protein
MPHFSRLLAPLAWVSGVAGLELHELSEGKDWRESSPGTQFFEFSDRR